MIEYLSWAGQAPRTAWVYGREGILSDDVIERDYPGSVPAEAATILDVEVEEYTADVGKALDVVHLRRREWPGLIVRESYDGGEGLLADEDDYVEEEDCGEIHDALCNGMVRRRMNAAT